MDISLLEVESQSLALPAFDEVAALRLGDWLVKAALDAQLPVVIDIRTANRTLFHASLPGSSPDNDAWARRKSNVALHFQAASLMVGERMRQRGRTLADQGLAASDYADHGGAVPIHVKGTGMVAVATVSGLPQLEDHRLVVRGLKALLANEA